MGRKRQVAAQPTIRDGDYESNGMYRWYIGPPGKHPKRSEAEQQQTFSEYKTYASQPWSARLAEWREWLTDMISPWWEGPFEYDQIKRVEKVDGEWRAAPIKDREIIIAHASTGGGYYRMIDGAPSGGYIHDAISALHRIDSLEKELAKGSDLDLIVRLAIEVGQDIETVRHQALFAPIVLPGLLKSRKSRIQAGRTNEKRAARRPDYGTAVRSKMGQGIKYTPACKQVADEYDVTPETVRNNTPELRPGGKRE